MKISMLLLIAISLLLQVTIDANVLGASWFAEPQDKEEDGTPASEDENEKESDSPAAAAAEADELALKVTQETQDISQEMQVKIDSKNAKEAAGVAKQAAHIATKVADHSVKVTNHAKSALEHALHALHEARVDSILDTRQTATLQKAENKLTAATKIADFGKVKKIKEDAEDLKDRRKKLEKALKDKMDRRKKLEQKRLEIEQMQKDINELRKVLKQKGGDAEGDAELEQLEKDLAQMENGLEGKTDAEINAEMKAEIDRLRAAVDTYDAKQAKTKIDYKRSKKIASNPIAIKPSAPKPLGERQMKATPVREKGIDIDSQMPYGDLEPFGREDTAQELTESSVRESDQMVDQLEKAEVAEEKRAVFRALTRLRGAAITSFDGVAKSQTGNIDQYNKVNKWRRQHPLHHLADEESDVSKWAFPDNADLLQASKKADLLQASKRADLLQQLLQLPDSTTNDKGFLQIPDTPDIVNDKGFLQLPDSTTNSTKTAVVLKPVVLKLKSK